MDKLNLKAQRHGQNVTNGLKYVVTTFFAQFPFHNKTLIGNVSYKVLPGDKVVVYIPYYASTNGTPILKLTALGAAISK